jgi:hypothetical protein
MSLSPKLIFTSSSVLIVSFSLMTGTAPISWIAWIVLRRLRNRVRWSMSSRVSRTCATFSPDGSNASAHASMSRRCPTAAVAWSFERSVGRFGRRSSFMPAPIAPELTIAVNTPRSRSAATCLAMLVRNGASSCPVGLSVSSCVPSLTTSVRTPDRDGRVEVIRAARGVRGAQCIGDRVTRVGRVV